MIDFKNCIAQMQKLGGFVDEQRKCWKGLHTRMDQLQDEVHTLGEGVRRQCLQLDGVQATGLESFEQSKGLKGSVEELGRIQCKSLEQLAGGLRKGAAVDVEDMKVSFKAAMDDGGALRVAMEAFDSRMERWELVTQQEARRWQAEATGLQAKVAGLEEVAKGVARHEAAALTAGARSEELGQTIQGLQGDLNELRGKLEKASESSLSCGLRRVKDLEDRGNVSLDRVSGEIRLLRPVEFAAVNPTDPSDAPRFANAEAAQHVLQDVAQLVALFDGPAHVEVHSKPQKGGTPAFWDEVAEASAGLVKAWMQENASVPPERVTAKGVAGNKGLNANAVVVRLDKAFFREEDLAGKGGGKGGAPPAKKTR